MLTDIICSTDPAVRNRPLGILTAQLALALDGVDREKILAQIVDLLAQRG